MADPWPAPTLDPEMHAGSPENLRALARLLAPHRCCGAPYLCGAQCQDDPLSDALIRAEREVREELERQEKDDG